MTNKRFIQVYLDLENGNGCWNCKNDWSICKVHNIGSVGFVKGVSHCALKRLGIKGDVEMTMIDINWIYEYGLKVVEKDVEEPILIVPTKIFEKLQKQVEGRCE